MTEKNKPPSVRRDIVITHHQGTFSVRKVGGSASVDIYSAHKHTLARLVEALGHVLTRWDDLGRVLSFLSASPEDRLNAAESLGIHFEEA